MGRIGAEYDLFSLAGMSLRLQGSGLRNTGFKDETNDELGVDRLHRLCVSWQVKQEVQSVRVFWEPARATQPKFAKGTCLWFLSASDIS